MIATKTFRVLIFAMLAMAGGCAATPRAKPPPEWPGVWSGRQLFYSHGNLVYAREGSVADQSAQVVADLAGEFTRRTGGKPTSGLIVVNDVEDSELGNLKPEELLTAEQQKSPILEMGIAPQELAFSMPVALLKDQLKKQAAFSDRALATIQWAAAIPSDRRVEQFAGHAIDAAIKKQDLNFAQRLLILPFMPMMHGVFDDAIHAQRDVVIYQRFCTSQIGWDEARRQKEAADYQAQRMKSFSNSLAATTQQLK